MKSSLNSIFLVTGGKASDYSINLINGSTGKVII